MNSDPKQLVPYFPMWQRTAFPKLVRYCYGPSRSNFALWIHRVLYLDTPRFREFLGSNQASCACCEGYHFPDIIRVPEGRHWLPYALLLECLFIELRMRKHYSLIDKERTRYVLCCDDICRSSYLLWYYRVPLTPGQLVFELPRIILFSPVLLMGFALGLMILVRDCFFGLVHLCKRLGAIVFGK